MGETSAGILERMAAAAAAAVPHITSRKFIEKESSDVYLKKLAFLDMKHDFGAGVTADIPYAGRGDHVGKHNFYSGFKTTIVRKVMGLSPSYSYEFDGCSADYADPEDFGLNEAIARMTPSISTHTFPFSKDASGVNISPIYTAIFRALGAYKVEVGPSQKIPIVIDYQYQLLDHGRTVKSTGLTENFVICRNGEHYADPGRTCRVDFQNINILTEVAGGKRTYLTALTGVPGDVTVEWTGARCNIKYGNLMWTESYSNDIKKYPNAIPMCILTANSLIKQNTWKDGSEYSNLTGEKEANNYCNTFKRDKEYRGVPFDGTEDFVKRIAAQFIKKRLADQLQAASCLQKITYTDRIQIGGPEKPCVFWTHDRLAAAFAILNGIPCVLEHSESAEKKIKGGGRKPATQGFVTVYVPRAAVGAQGGRGINRRERGAAEEYGEEEPVPIAGVSKKGSGAKEGGARRIVQKGGACTRGDIDAIIPGGSENSDILMEVINSNDACKNYMLQTIMTFVKEPAEKEPAEKEPAKKEAAKKKAAEKEAAEKEAAEKEESKENPYFDFNVLRRYIDYRLVEKGRGAAAADGGGGEPGEPGEPWDGWPENIHHIKKLDNGRFYVDKTKDSKHIAVGSDNVYVNNPYALRIDKPGESYKLMNGEAVQDTINIVAAEAVDVDYAGQGQEGGGGKEQRAIYKELHAFASLLRKTELEFAFIPESGELFLESSMHAEYHARDLYFFFQELMKLGEMACKAAGEDIRFLKLFQSLVHYLPTLLIEEAGEKGLCERVRLYLTTVDDYPFKKGKHDTSMYDKVLPWFQLLVKATYANAYKYTNRARLGGISYWASSFLRSLENWKVGTLRIAAPLHTRISPQTMKRLPAGILAGGRGGMRRTRKRMANTLRRRSTRRA